MNVVRRLIHLGIPKHATRRFASDTKPTNLNATATSTSTTTSPAQSISSIEARLPKRLRPYAGRFIHQPVPHITSFLLLHELTAIVPLFGFFYFFHATQWSPPGLPGQWVQDGVEKFGKYARRKGWKWVDGEQGGRILFELATAYAVVKALIPLRIGFSLWATPWFARTLVVPIGLAFRNLVPKRVKPPS